jgi:hypothetical protein
MVNPTTTNKKNETVNKNTATGNKRDHHRKTRTNKREFYINDCNDYGRFLFLNPFLLYINKKHLSNK